MTVTQSLITPQAPSEAKIAQVLDLVRDRIRKSGIGDDGLQAIIEAGGEFQQDLDPILGKFADRARKQGNEYSDERDKPNPAWSYDTATLPTTKKQIQNLRKALGIKPIIIPWQGETPPEADGLIAVTSLSDLGAAFKIADPLGEGYGPLIEKTVELLGASVPKFVNYRKGALTNRHVRLHAAVKARWEALEAREPAVPRKVRVFLLPVNTGKLYQGFSPRNARMNALDSTNRLPLDPAAVACILIAWPERLVRYEQVFIDCSGDEYSPGGGGSFGCVPYFCFRDGALKFGCYDAGSPRDYGGTAVAFLPE